MKLREMSTSVESATGSPVDFEFKSEETGKTFKVLSKTPGGQFLAVNLSSGKEVLLLGDVDRYTFTDSSYVQRVEIQSLIAKKSAAIAIINGELTTLKSQLAAIG